MGTITNIDELIGDAEEIVYKGKTYKLPPDIPMPTVFKLFQQFREVTSAQVEGGEAPADFLEKAVASLNDELLKLFQEGDPTLKELPVFGIKAFRIIMQKIFAALNADVSSEGNSASPESPKETTPGEQKTETTPKA